MKKKQTDDVADFTGAPAHKALGPADVQQKEFRVSRFGGYKMRDVDEFLDQVTESMNAMVEENRKQRMGGGGSMIGAPNLADTSRQADEIIQRARAQAEQIIGDAQAGAGSKVTPLPAGSGASADRGPVNAFLVQERAFLQSLAGLVQEHAETVKGMVRADRAAHPSGSGAPAAPAPSAPPQSSRPPEAKRREGAPAPESAAAPARPSDPRPTAPITKVDEPIRVDEPEPTPAPASARRDDDRPGDGADRSLRELFWGED
jgi:DivIVA domain-containing protein